MPDALAVLVGSNVDGDVVGTATVEFSAAADVIGREVVVTGTVGGAVEGAELVTLVTGTSVSTLEVPDEVADDVSIEEPVAVPVKVLTEVGGGMLAVMLLLVEFTTGISLETDVTTADSVVTDVGGGVELLVKLVTVGESTEAGVVGSDEKTGGELVVMEPVSDREVSVGRTRMPVEDVDVSVGTLVEFVDVASGRRLLIRDSMGSKRPPADVVEEAVGCCVSVDVPLLTGECPNPVEHSPRYRE